MSIALLNIWESQGKHDFAWLSGAWLLAYIEYKIMCKKEWFGLCLVLRSAYPDTRHPSDKFHRPLPQ
jgi:hypothetical protein